MRGYYLVLLATSLLGSALAASALYKLRTWSKRELWRILAFGSAGLIVSGLNLIIPAEGKMPMFGTLIGFALLFTLEHYALVHSCPEYIEEECPVHFLSALAIGALIFHNVVDGVVLGISARLGAKEFWSVFVGMTVHKFCDAITLLALLESEKKRFLKHSAIVALITLTTPLGAALIHVFLRLITPLAIMPLLAGVSAGSLIYIGASDILPRIHRLKDPPCFVYFLIGLIFMVVFLSFFH